MSCCSPVRVSEPPLAPSHEARPAARKADLSGMSAVPAGIWRIGHDGPEAYAEDREGPRRMVASPGFLIDRTAVTNSAFARFVAATNYVTEAERIGWSFVFYAQLHPSAEKDVLDLETGSPEWWLPVRGANWSRPDGAGTDWRDRDDHPVVHISWNDAVSYALWSGKRLPSESEWEIAARGGLEDRIYPWGNELLEQGRHRCNIWQGRFPRENTAEDGFLSTAPADAFEPNGYGLFNMVGNVWEWTSDSWSQSQPQLKAMRGGSYLCHRSHCNRYRVSARTSNAVDAASSHLGFRCSADMPAPSAGSF